MDKFFIDSIKMNEVSTLLLSLDDSKIFQN